MLSEDKDGNIDERHKARMQRKKRVIDEKMSAAQRDAGLIIVVTGNGKGKSSSGFGMVARALGHGMKVGVVQFIKGAVPTGEEQFFRRFPDEVEFRIAGEGYTWETQDRERDIQKAETGWAHAQRMLTDPRLGLVVLDEINIVLKYRYLDVREVLADLRKRPASQHVVMTGRAAPPEIIAAGDTVTEMMQTKHAFEQGIRAQKGVEW
jgi:cob(I)alamin adenosyltransferase